MARTARPAPTVDRLPAYARAYPFVELLLGVAYALAVLPVATNAVTLAVMAAGTAGVVRALVEAADPVRRPGAVLNLPMSAVTPAEDVLMAAMAAAMLAMLLAG